MSVVIYLNNQQVQIVNGTFNKSLIVKDCYLVDAPEGSIINGMVMDEEPFVEFLRLTWVQKQLPTKDVTLVVHSTKFIGKTIELPKLNNKKTIEYISREYADMGRDQNSIFAYLTLNNEKGKLNRVYAESIDPEFISDYMDIFEKAGIKLSKICSGESSLIRFTQNMVATRSRTFDLIIADKSTLTTILWIDGGFYYYNTARCFHDQGTLEYADDIARSVSQVIQFLKAQQVEFNLEKVLLAGLDIEHIGIYRRAIEDIGLSIPVQAFDFNGGLGGDNRYKEYIPGISGLLNTSKSENFLFSLQNNAEKNKKQDNSGKRTPFIVIGIIFVVMILATIGTAIYSGVKKNELNEIIDINESPDRMASLMFYDSFSSRNNYLNSQYNAIKDIEIDINTYPLGNQTVLDVFNKCGDGLAEVEYSSFSAAEGYISISAKADNVENINQFISNLTKEEIFNSVNYTGYQYEDDTEKWQINVTCVLASEAGREKRKDG